MDVVWDVVAAIFVLILSVQLHPSYYAHSYCFVVFRCGLVMTDFAHIA